MNIRNIIWDVSTVLEINVIFKDYACLLRKLIFKNI